MDDMSYQYYPLGYRRPLDRGEFRSEITPDNNVCYYYREMVARGSYKSTSREFKLKAISHALWLFGDFQRWLRAQDDNDRLTEHSREFLVDTIAFINTGRRPVSPNSRLQCIRFDMSDGDQIPRKQHRRKTSYSVLLQGSPEDYMFRWLNQPNGFEDMLCTLNVLFGNTNP